MRVEWRTPEIEERLAWRRRRALLVCSAVVALFFADDVWTGGPNTSRLVFIRSCWVLVLVVTSLSMVRVSPKARRLILRLVGIGCATCISGLALVRGDHQTAYFAFQLALPVCVVVILQDEVGAVVLCVLATLLGAGTILILSNTNTKELLQWLTCLSASSIIAVYASIHQRAQLREDSAQQQRLADSERARTQAERLALVGQLAAGVAHEINNPLAFVISNLNFLEAELAAPTVDADERSLVMMETQLGLKRIKGIVGDLTAFSREGAQETTEVDLHEVVTETERMATVRTKGRVLVLNELPVNLRRVIGNRRHLGQVFLNLILNAADALDSGRPDGKIWIRATTVGDGLQVEVEDNGPGFPDAVRASLFQAFFTTKAPGKGTGLGLATSREYMRRAGGDLLATSRPGGGARFTLALRCAP